MPAHILNIDGNQVKKTSAYGSTGNSRAKRISS